MREKLPERRPAVNQVIKFKSVAGHEIELIITIGYGNQSQVREVFCADFKAGSDNQAIVSDACILLSRLLQYGNTPADILKSMCSPPSLIGQICQAMCAEQEATAAEPLLSISDEQATNEPGDGKNAPQRP